MKKIFVIAAIMCSLLLFACNKKSENESMDDTTEYSTSTTETETQMTETQMTETLSESSSEGKLKANFDVPEEIKNFIANAYNEEVVENSSFSNNALLYDIKKILKIICIRIAYIRKMKNQLVPNQAKMDMKLHIIFDDLMIILNSRDFHRQKENQATFYACILTDVNI